MLIIPAIDLKDGCVVRFVQGRLNKKVYSRDPLKTAKHWQRQGAKIIHVVDLDGAMTGLQKNLNIVKEIVKAIDIPIQFGGGVRKIDTIKELLNSGIWRIVLGTKAAQDRSFLKNAFKKFKDKIIVSVDTQGSRVLIKGWKASFAGLDALKFVRILKETGFIEIIYTDILKDGTLKGPNIRNIKSLLKETEMKIIASGGISSLDDISRLKLLERNGLTGIIVGKALYEGKFTLSRAAKLG